MFIEKIPINYVHGKAWQIWLFGKSFLQYEKKNGEKRKLTLFPFCNFDKLINKNELMFYLKFNSTNYGFSLWCLHHWINIATASNGNYCIICDKPNIIKKILASVPFEKCEIRIIPSNKHVISKEFLKNICHPVWEKACLAHLTTFWHAKKHGLMNFWNIDADDTSFFLPPEKITPLLNKISEYSTSHNVSIMSLDMHRSRYCGRHWSFGVTFVNSAFMTSDILADAKNKYWKKNYEYIFDSEFGCLSNLDWFFTYLKDCGKIKIETFTLDDVYFIHWGASNTNGLYLMLQISKGRKMFYPFFNTIFPSNSETEIHLCSDVINFSSDFPNEESLSFLKMIMISRANGMNKFFERKESKI